MPYTAAARRAQASAAKICSSVGVASITSMRVHRPPDGFGDLREVDFAVHKGVHGHLVRGVEDRRHRPDMSPLPAARAGWMETAPCPAPQL